MPNSYHPIQKEENLPVTEKRDQYWHWSAEAKKDIFYAKEGLAAKKNFEAITFPQLLEKLVETNAEKTALMVERPLADVSTLPVVDGKVKAPAPLPHDQWKSWTYSEYVSDSKQLAKALINTGLEKYDAVSVFGFNSPEWSLSFLGAILAGGKCAGIYPTDTADQIQYKVDHANASVMTVDNQKNFNKVKGIVKNLPYLKTIVCWGELKNEEELFNKEGEKVKIFLWDEFLATGEQVSDETLQARMDDQEPGDSCVYVYTSGTTGNPKAVMLSHDSIIFAAYALVKKGLVDIGHKVEHERIISYLPLSHIAGTMVDIVAPIMLSTYMQGWTTTYFARPYDLKTGLIVERMQSVKPTIFLGVPRIWEKMEEKLKLVIGGLTGVKGKLAHWAMAQGLKWVESTNFDHSNPLESTLPHKGFRYWLADKLVLKGVRAKLGLDEAKFCFTGAAPIGLDTQRYMGNFGIVINEAYGMSEGTGVTCWCKTDLHLFGCCGPAFPCLEVKVFKVDLNDFNKKAVVPLAKNVFAPTEEEQGEICLRGRNIMTGYMANPRLGEEHLDGIVKKNKEAIDDEGFMHTGDKGTMSESGFVKITGRYKEIIVTAGGENVAPVPIEAAVKGICPIISNIVMIGDKRKFNIALVTLKLDGATGEMPGSEKLAKGEFGPKGFNCTTIDEAMEDESIIKEITDKIKTVNADGSVVVSNAAKIQKFMILPRDLSITTDDLTATLKLKRGFVTQKFAEVIDLMYDSKDVYVRFPNEAFSKYY